VKQVELCKFEGQLIFKIFQDQHIVICTSSFIYLLDLDFRAKNKIALAAGIGKFVKIFRMENTYWIIYEKGIFLLSKNESLQSYFIRNFVRITI